MSPSRPPRGGRGLKFDQVGRAWYTVRSPPSRGAWIEIRMLWLLNLRSFRRPPRGGRGLKSLSLLLRPRLYRSPPSRGAWIEMIIPN